MGIPQTHFLEAFFTAALGAVIAVPFIRMNIRFAPRLGLIDWPKARGIAEDQVPIIGPTLILLTVATVGGLMLFYSISPWFITTALIMAVMGYFDDRKPLAALDKIFFQAVCVAAVLFLDPQMRAAIPDKYGIEGSLWAAFFMIGLINAINFIDGIDGLAGIVIALGAAGAMMFSRSQAGYYPYFVLSSLIMGLMIPFLYYNVVKRKGFLGNVGSYFFSYVLAVIHMSIPMDCAGPVSRLAISGLCFLIPIADSSMVLLWRMFMFRSPFQADKGHLHHRLIQTSLPLRYILLNFMVIEAAALGAAVIMAEIDAARASLLPPFICISHVSITAILILFIEKASRRRIQSYFQRLDSGEPIYFMKYMITRADGGPVTERMLRRLEARVSAEIRVTDLCFTEKPNVLFVTLRTLPEPLRGISGRLDAVFHSERVNSTLVMDSGEFVKISKTASPLPKKAS